MSRYEDRLKDYITVDKRIEAFYAKHPNGSIQSQIVELTESRVVIKAYAYRDPDDTKPGIGHSSMNIPGSTTFTRGSEVENTETSAWGRAIAALGFEVKKGIASRDEIENKQSDESDPKMSQNGSNASESASVKQGSSDRYKELQALVLEAQQRTGSKELGNLWLKKATEEMGVTSKTITQKQIRELFERALTLTPPAEPEEESDLDF